MTLFATQRARVRFAVAVALLDLLLSPTPALADPISGAIAALLFAKGTVAFAIASFVITSVITFGLSLLTNALFGPKRREQDRQASVLSLNIGEVPREALFGECVTGGSLIDGFNWGGTFGTDWEALIIAVADHKCHSLQGFYIGDDYVTFAGDGAVAGYNGQLEVYWRDGSATQTAPSIVTNGGWSTTGNWGGVAFIVVAYKADDPKNENPTWVSGRPSFGWRVRGKFCYDPRKDSTVGGSGAHRWATPSTWEWTDNLSVCRYNWVRGIYAKDLVAQPEMLVIGRGLTSLEAPEAHLFAYANLCDEAVALAAGGTVKRYTFNGVIRSDEPFVAVERKFADCSAGTIIQRSGAVEVEPGAAKAVTATFTDADIISGTDVQYSAFRSAADRQWVNTVVSRYVEPKMKWQDHAAPVRRDTADVTADREPREQTLSLSGVTNDNQAGRVGEVTRRLGRLLATASLTLGPRFAGITEGDWVTWTSARYFGGAAKTFRVEAWSRGPDWRRVLQLREIAASVYAHGTGDEIADTSTAVPQTPPADGWQDAYTPVPEEARRVLIQNSYPVGLTITPGPTSLALSAHTRRYPDKDVSIGAVTLTGLSNVTNYGLYYDDAARDGTGITITATTVLADAFLSDAHPARHWVGNGTTQTSGGTGGGGGGATPPGGGNPIP